MEIVVQENNKKSPLIEKHLGAGAKIKTYFDWQLPASFVDRRLEVICVRNRVGLIDQCYLGIIKIGGKEAVQFLQGLVTNDVRGLSPGQGVRAAFLNGHGKVRAFCIILSVSDGFLIINDPQTHEKIFKYIFPFSYAGDFQVDDISTENKILSIQGPTAQLVLKEASFEPIPELNDYNWVKTKIADHDVLVVRHSRTGEIGYDLIIPEKSLQDVWDFIILKGQFHSILPIGLEALEVLRIEAGIPVYGIDIDETNMMLEAGLDDAISFSKGCYTGQEAVAMATYRGHVSKKLSGLVFDQAAVVNRGDKIHKDGKSIGFLSSVVESITFEKTIGLACIRYGYYEAGEKVDLITANGIVEATIAQLPFLYSL